MLDALPGALPNSDPSLFSTSTLGLGDYYRALYGQLRSALQDGPQGNAVVGVTSCLPGEGVTTVCHNVAIAAALQLRRPVLIVAAKGEISPEGTRVAGLYEVLAGQAQPADCIQPAAARDVYLLPAGQRAPRGHQHFPKETLVDLLALCRKEFAFVIVDLPPCNELTECLSIAGLLDGVLLVVEAERVRSQVVAHARDHLFQAGSRFLGVVLNKRKNHVPEWLYRRL